MVDSSNVLPQIIRAEYDPGSAFPSMIADAKRAAGQIKGEFDKAMGDGKTFKVSADSAVFAQMERDAGRLRAQLDPLYSAQQRFNAEMDRADNLLHAGAISQREYAAAAQLSRDALQEANAALFRAADGAKIGTTANHLMVNSTRSLRQAMLQASQQGQDIAISLYSGQRAATVFAQQLPQLAFALTGLEGSANKTHDRIGRFATFMSGPWGLLVGLGIGVLLDLGSALFKSGEEAEKAEKRHRTLDEVLGDEKRSVDELTEATNEYVKAQQKAREVDILSIQARAESIKKNLMEAASLRETLKVMLERAQHEAFSVNLGSTSNPFYGYRKVSGLEERIAENNKSLAALVKDAGEVKIEAATAISSLNSDAEKRISEGFDILRRRAKEAGLSVIDLTKRLDELAAAEKKALDALDTKGQKGGSAYSRANAADRAESIIPFLSPVSGPITSGFGSRRDPLTGRTSFHAGVDYGVPVGTRVRAPAEGVVSEVGRSSGNGIFVRINHGGGTETTFLHLSEADVVEGQVLSAGEYFAKSGNTGRSTGPHLDYRVKANGKNVDPTRGRFAVGSTAEAAAHAEERSEEAMQRLAEFGRDARASIEAMRLSFTDTPPAIQQSQRELEKLRDLAAEIQTKKPEGWQAMLATIEELRPAAADLANGPFRDMVKAAQEQAAIDALILAGKRDEAEVMRRQLAMEKQGAPLDKERQAALLAIVQQERLRSREMEKQNLLQQRQIALLEQTESNIRDTVYGLLRGGGLGSIGSLFKRQFDAVMQDLADSITEDLFGDWFRDGKDKVLGFDKVKEASERQVAVTRTVVASLNDLADAAQGASGALGGPAANDNFRDADMLAKEAFSDIANEITVTAPRNIGRTIKSSIQSAFGADFFGKLTTAMQFAALGQAGSGIGKSLGIKQSKLGGAIGGAAIGFAVGGPVGAIIGGFLGGSLGGLLKKTPKGTATISNTAVSYKGVGKFRKQLTEAGGGVQDSITDIAEALGGSVGGYSVSLKRKGKKYYVNGTKIGKDEQEAAEAAILAAIQQGAVKGIRAGAQRLLQAGTDLDKALAKAVKFQGVFDDLRSRKDPAGYAIEKLNREFEGLIAVFKEAGASAEEWAQLEELYGLKRGEAIEAATEAMAGTLRQFIADLETGDNGLSLRDRLANANAILNPFKADLAAGRTVDYDKYVEASRTVMDIARQLYGSQNEYFAVFNEILGLSKSALAGQENVISIASGAASPFTSGTPTIDTVPVVTAINDQSQLLLEQFSALNLTQARTLAAIQAGTASGFTFDYAKVANYF